MSIKRVVIESDERLEGELQEGAGKHGVAICHPHPLYGGSMWNNVVDAIESGFSRVGFSTLRFNFRGVGGSTGRYGEGEGEVRDAAAAYGFMKERLGLDAEVVLAGYSFGAWIAAKVGAGQLSGLASPATYSAGTRQAKLAEPPPPSALFLVAYPFAYYDAEELRRFTGRIYLVGGSLDDISPLNKLMDFYRGTKAEKYLKVLPSSHFFEGREKEIADFIIENFTPEAG